MIYKISRIVKILFQRVSVERILTGDKNKKLYYDALSKEYLQDVMLTYNQEFSDTEINLQMLELEYQVNQVRRESLERYSKNSVNVFSVLFYYVPEVLTFDKNRVICKYPKILEWNELIRGIGEDLPVLARLAMRDVEYGIETHSFSWQPIIGHNNFHLDRILQKGLADNHFHLRGSSAHFDISWINLMNHPGNSEFQKSFFELEKNYRDKKKKAEVGMSKNPLWILNAQAALIRLYLSSCIYGFRIRLRTYEVLSGDVWDWVKKYGSVAEFAALAGKVVKTTEWEEIKIERLLTELKTILGRQNEFSMFMGFLDVFRDLTVPVLKNAENLELLYTLINEVIKKRPYMDLEECRFFLPRKHFDHLWRQETLKTVEKLLQNPTIMMQLYLDDIEMAIHSAAKTWDSVDYMLGYSGNEYFRGEEEYRILAGERCFLYKMLRVVLEKNASFTRNEVNLFYAYIRIKNEIRSELVQSNPMVGFENFQEYQRRKDWFAHVGEWKTTEGRLARLAVRDVLNNKAVKFLEVRISPGNSAEENLENVCGYDSAIINDQSIESLLKKEIARASFYPYGEWPYSEEEKELQNRFYYVFHFTKKPEDTSEQEFERECRHYQYRKEIKNKADAIMRFREKYPLYAQRLVGIDACSMEIGCRPEIFAWIFRELKNHVNFGTEDSYRLQLPKLRITYHVGEDFLDVADGLRAIDEAVRFLDMQCGDRLGHALALGIDVKKWYAFKGKQITTTLQDYLDTIVWLYQSLIKYHIQDMSSLKGWLEKQYSLYFTYIYSQDRLETKGNAGVNLVQGNFDINTYYFSWMLRGDKPEVYKQIKDGRICYHPDSWERYAVGRENPRSDDIRNIPEVVLLYYMYHYNHEAKKRGREEKTIPVTDKYIEGVAMVQKALREKIVQKGIGIETNPTSNLHIGTLRGYGDHPIKTFYNLGLTKNEQELMDCPQICVSINTDDKGIFATRIENEYALLACALENEQLPDGSARYKREFIYEWLDNIREMGLRQVFWNDSDSQN